MKSTLARFALLAAALAATGVFSPARADDKDFVTQHISDVVKTDLMQITDAPVLATFSAPMFNVTITIKDGDGGTQTQSLVVARSGGSVIPLSRPSGDGDCPQILKLLNPSLKLTGDDAANSVQNALDLLYPIMGDGDKGARGFAHTGNDWKFARGFFFGQKLGFIFTTDASGAVTAVKFALKMM